MKNILGNGITNFVDIRFSEEVKGFVNSYDIGKMVMKDAIAAIEMKIKTLDKMRVVDATKVLSKRH